MFFLYMITKIYIKISLRFPYAGRLSIIHFCEFPASPTFLSSSKAFLLYEFVAK